jgi:mannosyltransferase OCH1-like enzyme
MYAHYISYTRQMYINILIIVLVIVSIIFLTTTHAFKKKEKFSEQSKIPLHIYQTWCTKSLPPKMKQCVDKLKVDNPEFTHHLFDDTMCKEFIENNFNKNVLHAYINLKPGAFKADLWRYCVLYKKGGVYLDIKYQCEPDFKLIDLVKDNNNIFVGEFESDNSPNPLGTNPVIIDDAVYTGLIISKPNNPIFYKVIEKICDNVKTKYYDQYLTGQTGPVLFRKCFQKKNIQNIQYAYYEVNHRGFIKNIHNNKLILSFYPEYRNEQKHFGKTKYWKDMWRDKDIYL